MLVGPTGSREGRRGKRVSHSITSLARSKIAGGIVRPSALAVFRLTTSSKWVGCSNGRSAGLAPRRILSTNAAARSKLL